MKVLKNYSIFYNTQDKIKVFYNIQDSIFYNIQDNLKNVFKN